MTVVRLSSSAARWTPTARPGLSAIVRLGAVLAVLAIVAGVGVMTWPAAVLGADPPGSSLYVDLDPQGGGYTISLPDDGDWHTRSSTPSATITGQTLAVGNGGQGFSVSDGRWFVSFVNKTGSITTGTFDIPQPVEEVSCGPICGTVGTVLPGTHGDCYGAGPFTIHDIAFDGAGALVLVDADFRMTCFNGLMSGAIRYHSDRATVALDQTADRVFFPLTTIGQTTTAQSVTLTNIGSVSTHLGTAALGGSEPGDFTITTDTCSGADLAVGDACVITVTFAPTAIGNRFADLSIADGTSRGSRAVRLIGYGQQQSTLTFEATHIPTSGPATATFTLTLTPPAGDLAPVLMIDGAQAYGPTETVLASPTRKAFTYNVTVGTGHHVATAELRQSGWYLGATAPPIPFDVGTTAALELTTATDDGVAAGEPVTLAATLRTGAPVFGGTIRIRDAATDAILASGPAAGSMTIVTADIPSTVAGTHAYHAEFVPPSADVQAAADDFDLVVVAGTRPATSMDTSTIYTSTFSTTSDFTSPDAGVTFQCRVGSSDWFMCLSPAQFQSNDLVNTLSVRAVGPGGLGDRTPATRSWIIELTPPTTTSPTPAGFVPNSPLAASGVATRVRWTGADAGSGIDHFSVYLSIDSGPLRTIAPSVTASSLVRNLATGHVYRYGVRAVDRAGNASAIRLGPSFRIAAISDGSHALRYAGQWTTSISSIWWGGTARSSSASGATASYTFVGKSISWVGLKASNRGKAAIYVNGVYKAMVDLYSATTQSRAVVWTATFSTSATRTVTIKVLGTAGRPRVDIDGFIVGS